MDQLPRYYRHRYQGRKIGFFHNLLTKMKQIYLENICFILTFWEENMTSKLLWWQFQSFFHHSFVANWKWFFNAQSASCFFLSGLRFTALLPGYRQLDTLSFLKILRVFEISQWNWFFTLTSSASLFWFSFKYLNGNKVLIVHLLVEHINLHLASNRCWQQFSI